MYDAEDDYADADFEAGEGDYDAETAEYTEANQEPQAQSGHTYETKDFLPAPGSMPSASDFATSASMSTVSQDEAFSRALNAMYWGGYWTAVYHCQRSRTNPAPEPKVDEVAEEPAAAEGEGDEANGMNTT